MVGENGGELSDVSQESLESSRGEALKCVVVGGKDGEGALSLQGTSQATSHNGSHQGGGIRVELQELNDIVRGIDCRCSERKGGQKST